MIAYLAMFQACLWYSAFRYEYTENRPTPRSQMHGSLGADFEAQLRRIRLARLQGPIRTAGRMRSTSRAS